MSAVEPSALRTSPETMLPELFERHPQVRRIFDRYGLKGCGGRRGPAESVRFFAQTHGVAEDQLLREVDESIARPTVRVAEVREQDLPADVADTIYRRFFTAGIWVILTAGATWGAWLLWKIGLSGTFTGVSIHEVNAHGHAQIFGWVGLFIMGFAAQAFPRMWHSQLAGPRIIVASFVLMIIGLIIRTIGMTTAGAWEAALPLAMGGAVLEVAAIALFVAQIVITFRRSEAKIEPYIGFIALGMIWFIVQAVFSGWHTWTTMTAWSRQELLWYVGTYQAVLRDVQIHGLALFMILGVSMRMLPAFFDVPKVSVRRGWWALGVLTVAVLGESIVFIAYRWSGNHAMAALLMIPWIMLAVGVAMVALPWRLWRPLPLTDRSAKFVRAAYGWLAVSLIMLLLLPVYQWFAGVPFSHAYYGGIRHAITVGFISMMIMGMAAKVVPTLNGVDPRGLRALWGPFVLINLGCFLRVSLQTLTDWHEGFFALVGISGMLEVTALAWWGAGLIGIMRRGKREASAHVEPAPFSGGPGPGPGGIVPEHTVAQVLGWYPATLEVFLAAGFTPLRNGVMRRTVARVTTLRQAAALRGVDLGKLLADLDEAVGADRGPESH